MDCQSEFFKIDLSKVERISESSDKLQTNFTRSWIAIQVIFDANPKFRATKFQQFSQTWRFEHYIIHPDFTISIGDTTLPVLAGLLDQEKTLFIFIKSKVECIWEHENYLTLGILNSFDHSSQVTNSVMDVWIRWRNTRHNYRWFHLDQNITSGWFGDGLKWWNRISLGRSGEGKNPPCQIRSGWMRQLANKQTNMWWFHNGS